jgi:hypothetical protein
MGFMKCVVEIGLGGMIYIQSFMKIGAGVQAILRCCFSNLKRCNVGITGEGFMNYAVEMGSGAMMYITSFIQIGSAIQKLLAGIHIHSKVIE